VLETSGDFLSVQFRKTALSSAIDGPPVIRG
jgi:hypothetical protein